MSAHSREGDDRREADAAGGRPPPRPPHRVGPLSGRRVLLTRDPERARETREALETLGARVLVIPTTRHIACEEGRAFLRALERPQGYTHLVFTSQTAVRFFVEACSETEPGVAAWSPLRLAAVGPATAKALRALGWEPQVISSGGGEELARVLIRNERLGSDSRVLIPQSARARPELRESLEKEGVPTEAIAFYDTVPEDPSRLLVLLESAWREGRPDVVLFASPSAFDAFLNLPGDRFRVALREMNPRIVSIGRTTSSAIRARGYPVCGEATTPTVEGMVAVVERVLTERAGG